MEINKCVEYVNSNTEYIASCVNNCFELSKESLKIELIEKIKEYLNPLPMHYVWKYDNNPYDNSGIIVEDGTINLNQTIIEFLENEYNGNKEATYMSGMGWRYNTYEDELQYCTIELAANIMFDIIKKCIESKFSINISDKEFEEIRESCGDFDRIYDDCMASDFFFVYPMIEFVEIGNIKLIDLLG